MSQWGLSVVDFSKFGKNTEPRRRDGAIPDGNLADPILVKKVWRVRVYGLRFKHSNPLVYYLFWILSMMRNGLYNNVTDSLPCRAVQIRGTRKSADTADMLILLILTVFQAMFQTSWWSLPKHTYTVTLNTKKIQELFILDWNHEESNAL